MTPDFGWEADVEEADDEPELDEDTEKQAEEIVDSMEDDLGVPELRENVESGTIEDTDWIHDAIEATTDVDLLKEAWLLAHGELRESIRDQLHELDAVPPEAETSEQADLEDSVAGDSTQESDSNSAESTEASESDSSAEEDSTRQETTETPSEGLGADESPDDPFADLGGDSVNLAEAREMERRRRVIVWGPPGAGKTHNAYTADPPLALIDTEGKAHDLAGRFDLDPEEVRIWQPENFTEAQDALEQALEWLQAWLDEYDRRGTVIVDSMSMMWEWAKSHYIHEYYIEPDPTGKYEKESDVDLKSSMQSNDPDWPRIKEYHNDGFRQKMVNSPFHFVWTQMAKEDFGEKIEKDLSGTPDKPHGEKENPYKANYILHIRETGDGTPVADLEKSGTTQHTFAGLEWPTQPKVFDIMEDIEEAENSPEDVPPGEVTDYDVELIKGKPSRLRGVNNES